MATPPPTPPPLPPPLPPNDPTKLTPDYANPYARHQPPPAAGGAQRVFDTFAGPNLRLRDNLIQGACVLVGTLLGAVVGYALGPDDNKVQVMLVGALGGMIVSVVISGLVIGIIRMRRR